MANSATKCPVEGCETLPARGRKGFCLLHYTRVRRYGDPSINRRKPADIPNEKTCTGCGERKQLADYSPHRRMHDGRQSKCRECCREWNRRFKTENPEQVRAWGRASDERLKLADPDHRWSQNLKNSYGLSVDEFQAMLERQGGGCAVCAGPANGPGKRFQVDHDHSCCPGVGSCGKCIRGLLCSSCNTAIGLMGDDTARLDAAIKYLNKQ